MHLTNLMQSFSLPTSRNLHHKHHKWLSVNPELSHFNPINNFNTFCTNIFNFNLEWFTILLELYLRINFCTPNFLLRVSKSILNNKYSFFYVLLTVHRSIILVINPLTPNDLYMSRTTPLTSKRFILYIYSTNVGT